MAHLPLPGNPLGLRHGDVRLPLPPVAARLHARRGPGDQGVHPRRGPRERRSRSPPPALLHRHGGLGQLPRALPCDGGVPQRRRRIRAPDRAHHLGAPGPLRRRVLLARQRLPPAVSGRGRFLWRDHPSPAVARGAGLRGEEDRHHRIRRDRRHSPPRPGRPGRGRDDVAAHPDVHRPASRGRHHQPHLEDRAPGEGGVQGRALQSRRARHDAVCGGAARAVAVQVGAPDDAASLHLCRRARRALLAGLPAVGPARVQGAERRHLHRHRRGREGRHRPHRHVYRRRHSAAFGRGNRGGHRHLGHRARAAGVRRRLPGHRR